MWAKSGRISVAERRECVFPPSFRGSRRLNPESIGPHGAWERWIPGARFTRPGMTKEDDRFTNGACIVSLLSLLAGTAITQPAVIPGQPQAEPGIHGAASVHGEMDSQVRNCAPQRSFHSPRNDGRSSRTTARWYPALADRKI